MAAAANPGTSTLFPLKTRHITESQYPAGMLDVMLALIKSTRLTGQLTLNFSNGTMAGMVQWREQAKGKLNGI